MASRQLLHKSKRNIFIDWLENNGWEMVILTRKKIEAMIVLQAKNPNYQHPITVWDRLDGDHLSVLDRDIPIIKKFIKETRK